MGGQEAGSMELINMLRNCERMEMDVLGVCLSDSHPFCTMPA